MNRQFVWNGDFRPDAGGRELNGWPLVTVVEFIGEMGELRAKVIRECHLPVKPKWKAMSMRGYQQSFEMPEGFRVDMSDAKTYWNARIVENGATLLFNTMQERDEFLER